MRIPPPVQSTPWAVSSNDDRADDELIYDDTPTYVVNNSTYSAGIQRFLQVILIIACITMALGIISFAIFEIVAALPHDAGDSKVVAAKPVAAPIENKELAEPKKEIQAEPKIPLVANRQKDEPKWIAKALEVKRAYFKNVAAADLKYSNKPILAEGEVLTIIADPQTRGAYIVEVENGSMLGFYEIVSCHFAEQQAIAVAKLERGARVRIVGNLSSNRVTPNRDLGMSHAKVDLSIVNSDLISVKPPVREK